ncbi:MAG: response regulator [Saprospiraceae bacterium]
MEKISILLADDHHLFRYGIKQIFEKEELFQVIGEAESAESAFSLCLELQPDLVIMDISFPDSCGKEYAKRIVQLLETKVLALTSHIENSYVIEMLRAGASGYLIKDSTPEELIRAVRTIHSGHSYFSSNLSKTIFENSTKEKKLEEVFNQFSVTSRELEVLRYVSEEMTNKEIAHQLFISPRTVETHKRNLMQKLKVRNVVGLAKYYFHFIHQLDPSLS